MQPEGAGCQFGSVELHSDPKLVRALRCELLAEHLDRPTGDLDDRAALALYRQLARDNRRKRDIGDFNWQGLAFSLDPATCGE
jgi:cardiolipin synthase